jgi:hypothetical protein
MKLLNLEEASKIAMEYYLEKLPFHPLQLDYSKMAEQLLNNSCNLSLEDKRSRQRAFVQAGLAWELYGIDDFEEQLRLKMFEWSVTPSF